MSHLRLTFSSPILVMLWHVSSSRQFKVCCGRKRSHVFLYINPFESATSWANSSPNCTLFEISEVFYCEESQFVSSESWRLQILLLKHSRVPRRRWPPCRRPISTRRRSWPTCWGCHPYRTLPKAVPLPEVLESWRRTR